jgi:hypothetical protein
MIRKFLYSSFSMLWHDAWKLVARQLVGKHIPAEMNTQATIEELPFLRNGEVNIPL